MSLLRAPIRMGELSARLDAMSQAERNEEVLRWGRRAQSRLFEAAEGHMSVDLDFLVAPEKGLMNEVVHEGLYTLPAFRRFAKVFCRPEGRDELWGYNRTNGLLLTAVGPGYYVARRHGEGELIVDYLSVPPSAPAGWPPIRPNEERLSRFVYAGTQDVLRADSKHVSTGRAQKAGKWLPAWFVLTRQE